MRRLALVPVLALLAGGCGWQSLLLQTSPIPGPAVSHGCTVVTPDGHQRPCSLVPIDPVRSWVKVEHLSPAAVPGAKLFARAGCTACHTYDHAGSSNLGAPDLTAIGKRHRGIAFEIAHLECPNCTNPGSPMPAFRSLGPRRLRQLAIFLEASKGTH